MDQVFDITANFGRRIGDLEHRVSEIGDAEGYAKLDRSVASRIDELTTKVGELERGLGRVEDSMVHRNALNTLAKRIETLEEAEDTAQ